jgi:hypothetical protein
MVQDVGTTSWPDAAGEIRAELALAVSFVMETNELVEVMIQDDADDQTLTDFDFQELEDRIVRSGERLSLALDTLRRYRRLSHMAAAADRRAARKTASEVRPT